MVFFLMKKFEPSTMRPEDLHKQKINFSRKDPIISNNKTIEPNTTSNIERLMMKWISTIGILSENSLLE
jgi:hypothetical protein